MSSKEKAISQAEDFIKADREKLLRKEQVVYRTRIPLHVAQLLGNAMLQRREEEAARMPGAFSHDDMRAMPSAAETKLVASVASFTDEILDGHDEIEVSLQGMEIDEINSTLFPALRPHMLADSKVSEMLDGLVTINEAYKAAGGTERPSYAVGMKPFQS